MSSDFDQITDQVYRIGMDMFIRFKCLFLLDKPDFLTMHLSNGFVTGSF